MTSLKLRLTAAAIFFAGLNVAPAWAAPVLSWGKAGVSFENYRADAMLCLREAAATDLSGTAPANALILASRRLEIGETGDYTPMINGAGGLDPMSGRPSFDPSGDTALRVGRANAAARVDRRIEEARRIIEARLDTCLFNHGYHRFRLTREQQRRLDRFPARAPERQLYLHRLASDAGILAAQGV